MTAYDTRAALQREAAFKIWAVLTDPQRKLAREIAASPGGEMVVPGARGSTAKVLRSRGVLILVRDPSVHRVTTAFIALALPSAPPADHRPRLADRPDADAPPVLDEEPEREGATRRVGP